MKTPRFFGLSVFFLLLIVLALNSSTQATPLGTKPTAPPNLELKDLPAGAQASISGVLGKDNPAYHFTPVVDGWRIRHWSQGLDGTLDSKGLHRQGLRFRQTCTWLEEYDSGRHIDLFL